MPRRSMMRRSFVGDRLDPALIDAGIDHEFVVVPQAFHEFAGAEEEYLLMKLTGWFDRHVKRRLG
jgi:dipeptidyl aminopeptidase/acylaminoacyl peptidase